MRSLPLLILTLQDRARSARANLGWPWRDFRLRALRRIAGALGVPVIKLLERRRPSE